MPHLFGYYFNTPICFILKYLQKTFITSKEQSTINDFVLVIIPDGYIFLKVYFISNRFAKIP